MLHNISKIVYCSIYSTLLNRRHGQSKVNFNQNVSVYCRSLPRISPIPTFQPEFIC